MNFTAEFLIDKRKSLWEEKKEIEEDYRYRIAAAKEILKEPELLGDIKKHPEKLIELEFVIVDKKKTSPVRHRTVLPVSLLTYPDTPAAYLPKSQYWSV